MSDSALNLDDHIMRVAEVEWRRGTTEPALVHYDPESKLGRVEELSKGRYSFGGLNAVSFDHFMERLERERSMPLSRVRFIEKPDLPPMSYFPRLWRPGVAAALQRDRFASELQAAQIAVLPLFQRLQEIFEIVQPDIIHRTVYGHALRHLLILACTEVEASLRGVLSANGYTPSSGRFTTKDYVKLSGPMRLPEWELALSSFPGWPSEMPFAGWNPAEPTKSLPWYDAYNAAKHDRERALERAELRHVITALAAVVVLAHAQFGPDVEWTGTPFAARMALSRSPAWAAAEYSYGIEIQKYGHYRPDDVAALWKPTNFAFP